MIENRPHPTGAYGTHIHPLLIAVFATKGKVIEFGTGDFSTPVLHEVCKSQDRTIVSYDDHEEWHKNFTDLRTETHDFQLVKNWKDVKVEKCGVVLIDHAPAMRRVVDIERFKDAADILVVHDTDKMKWYGYTEAFKAFKYKHTYMRYSKSTTLLSNTIDVQKLF